jgi:hypothetical protein
MPKIRLSALAVDMKGKAGGSVFSRNAGGVYFRNNKTGGGKKSPSWDKQKANLAAVSRQWKQLTIEEQDAWAAAAVDYPAKTVWGDTRQPSGYELYTRLNGVLQGAGLPVITVPVAPRSLVDMGETEIVFPDLVQFQPQRVLNFRDQPATFGQMHALAPFQDYGIETRSFTTFHIRVNADFVDFPDDTGSRQYGIFGQEATDEPGIALYFIKQDTGEVALYFDIYEGASYTQYSCALGIGWECVNRTITVTMNDDAVPVVKIYIDGVSQTLTDSSVGTLTGLAITKDFRIGCYNQDVKFFGTISDFRIYKKELDEADAALIANNYILGSEFLSVPFINFTANTVTPIAGAACAVDSECDYGYQCVNGACVLYETGTTPSYDTLGINQQFFIIGQPYANKALINVSPGFVPTLTLTVENANLSGTYLQVYASPPMSAGIVSRSANVKLIGTYEYGANLVFDLTADYKAIYGNVPGGSSVQFFLVVVDSVTGVNTQKMAPKKPKRVRFKAGAELSGSVN